VSEKYLFSLFLSVGDQFHIAFNTPSIHLKGDFCNAGFISLDFGFYFLPPKLDVWILFFEDPPQHSVIGASFQVLRTWLREKLLIVTFGQLLSSSDGTTRETGGGEER